MKRVPPRPTASCDVGDTPTLTASLPVPPFGDGTRSRAVQAHPRTTTSSQPKRTRSQHQWACHTCHATFTAWEAAQTHADSHGGGRLDLQLPGIGPHQADPDDDQHVDTIRPRDRFL